MEGAAAASPAPDSSSSQRIRPAVPVRVVAAIFPDGTGGGSFRVATCVEDSSVVSVVPLHQDLTPRPGAPAPHKDRDYRLHWCYPDDDESCKNIFEAEVKPLVDAIFRGTNSCVVACGAVAKTNLIMDQPAGLLTMAMKEILLLSEPIGAVVSVSSYQVVGDSHVIDLLEPKENEVLIQDDADGRTNLMGLSKVPIKSTQEFNDLSCCGTNMTKHPATKPSNNLQPRGGHHGFIICISMFDQEGKECLLAKMNFLDLAGYVDPKERSNSGCLAQANCNKSMHALMKVVRALNSNQSFIPYRESKLTRILQDSLCETNSAVLIACLDEFSSQDVVSTLSLASGSSQVVNEPYYRLLPLGTSSALSKRSRHQLNKSAIKASRTPAANKRCKLEMEMHTAKKSVSSLSTYTKQGGVMSALKTEESCFVQAPIYQRMIKYLPHQLRS